MNTYILSQIFVIMSYLFLINTYQVKSNKKMILILNIVACIFSATGFFFLKAYAGCIMSLIAVVRNILFANKKINKFDSLIIILAIIVLLSLYTYQNVFSLLPVIATILYSLSVWQDNNKLYKIFGIPIEMCWLSYHIYVKSLFGIILESILFGSVVIGIVRKK
ncbi:MAG: YgjV family protein [Bacilli bacterium]|nr:YgjV family protein [Bacilli bacterium]MBQ6282382.1 YgjV family protein [Bacilli bacterium]